MKRRAVELLNVLDADGAVVVTAFGDEVARVATFDAAETYIQERYLISRLDVYRLKAAYRAKAYEAFAETREECLAVPTLVA